MKNEEKKLIEKISKYIYDRGLNLSGGVKTSPTQDGIESGTLIDNINIGLETPTAMPFVRANFRGSKKYFQIPIKPEDFHDWASRFTDLHKYISSGLLDDDLLDF